MGLIRLTSVDAFIAIDFDDSPNNGGGTRLAPDVSEQEAALLARAMTYKYAILGRVLGGAKAVIRATAADRDEALARYCEEIRPLVESGRFRTGPDLGTSEADFAPLRTAERIPPAMSAVLDGVPFEDLLTGAGVIAAADAAVGGLEGRTVALEGFGKVGGGAAREVMRRGGRLVALSTIAGSVHDEAGLPVERLLALRAEHGDECIAQIGLDVRAPAALFDVEADVLVPGARIGVIDGARARTLTVRAVVPAANVPYTAAGLDVLRERGIPAHADFVCNAGAVFGYLCAGESGPEEVLDSVARTLTEVVREVSEHPDGPFAGACEKAETFLRTWRPEGGLPPSRPFAP